MVSKKRMKNIGFFTHVITSKLYRYSSQELKKRGLTHCQFCMLILMNDGLPHSMGDLRNELSISSSMVTANVEILVKRDLVKREYSPKDRRVVKVVITTKGKRQVTSIMSTKERQLKFLFKNLDTGEQKIVEKLGKLFLNALKGGPQ